MKRLVLLLTSVLTFVGCDYFRPLDGPGMERTDDGLDSIAVANARRAVESFETKQYRMVEYYGNKALAEKRMYEHNPKLYYQTWQYLISTAFDNGEYKKGLDLITAALDKSAQEEEPELKAYEARFMAQMGMGQMRLSRVREGIKSCDDAYRKFEALIGDNPKWELCYMWYRSTGEAVQHFAICDIKTALEWLPRMEQTYKKAIAAPDMPDGMADYCLSKLELTKAEVYMKADDKKEAERHFNAYQQTEVAKSGEEAIDCTSVWATCREKEYLLHCLWPRPYDCCAQMESVKGRALFVYSDGLNEAENEQKVQLGEQKLIDILRSTDYESSRQVIERMEREVEHHRNGAEPNDDLTMMCIHVK